MKRCLVFLIVSFLVSCTATYETAIERYSLARSCCQNFSEFSYAIFSKNKPLVFDINQMSPAFRFTSGKSYFKALRLPALPLPYTIKIRSYAQGESIERAHIFFPKVLLLREDFSIADEIAPIFTVEKSYGGAMKENTWGLPVRLSGEITIGDAEQIYLLVITTNELLSSYVSWTQVMTGLAMPAGALGLVPEGVFAIRNAPFGRLALELEIEKCAL